MCMQTRMCLILLYIYSGQLLDFMLEEFSILDDAPFLQYSWKTNTLS